jgi:hypothetical protein
VMYLVEIKHNQWWIKSNYSIIYCTYLWKIIREVTRCIKKARYM